MDVDEGYGMVGRDDQIDEFGKIWEKGDGRIVVIHGPKLVGKSTFVKYFFDKYSKHDKVIRFDFNMIKNLEEFEYELFCNDNFQVGHTSGCRRVSRCTNCARNLQLKITELGKRRPGRLVFILDNLESMCDDGKERTMGEERTYDLIMRLYMLDILKRSLNVSLVIVSTMKHTFARYRVHYVELKELDLKSSSTLLCNVAGHDRCTDKMEIVTKIAELCGGLPLAIINAGGLFHEDTMTPKDILAVLCVLRIQSLSGEMLPSTDKIDFNLWSAFASLSNKNQENLIKLATIVGVSINDVESISVKFDYKEDMSVFKWRVLCPLRNRNLIKVNKASSVAMANDLLAIFLDVLPLLQKGASVQKKIDELVDTLEANLRNTNEEENDSGRHHRCRGDIISGNSSCEHDIINLGSENNGHVYTDNNIQRHQNSWEANNSLISLSSAPSLDVASLQI